MYVYVRQRSAHIVPGLVLGIGLGFLVLPTFVVIPLSLNGGDFLILPPSPVSIRWYEALLGEPAWTGAIARSILLGAGAATLATVVGLAAAWYLAPRRTFATRAIWLVAVSPILMPPIVLAIGSFIAYSALRIEGSLPALVLTHAVLGVPFPVVLGTVAIARLDRRIELAARGLGASPARVMFHVTIPRLLPTIAASWALAFLVSLDEVVITSFLLPRGLGTTLPIQLYTQLQTALTPQIAAVSGLLIAVAFTFTLVIGGRMLVGQRRTGDAI